MWVWRKMAKVSWTEKKTHEEVLRMTGQNRKLIETIVDRKKNWIGHVLRGDGLMLEVTEARMTGKRGRGRKRIWMLDELIEESYVELKRKAQDRQFWQIWKPCMDLPLRQNTNDNSNIPLTNIPYCILYFTPTIVYTLQLRFADAVT